MAMAVAIVAPNPNQLHIRLITIMGSIIMGRTAHTFTLRDTRLRMHLWLALGCLHMHMIHVMMQG